MNRIVREMMRFVNSPHPTSSPCEQAKWDYRQAKSCYDKRQAWEERWGNASTRAIHARALADVKRRMSNAARAIAVLCAKQCP